MRSRCARGAVAAEGLARQVQCPRAREDGAAETGAAAQNSAITVRERIVCVLYKVVGRVQDSGAAAHARPKAADAAPATRWSTDRLIKRVSIAAAAAEPSRIAHPVQNSTGAVACAVAATQIAAGGIRSEAAAIHIAARVGCPALRAVIAEDHAAEGQSSAVLKNGATQARCRPAVLRTAALP